MKRWIAVATAYFILQQLQALGIIDRLLYGQWDGKPGNKVTQGLNLLFIVASVALALAGRPRWAAVRTRATQWLLVVLFLLSSAAWSIDASTSIRQSVLYLFLVVGAIGVASTMSVDRFMGLTAASCFTAASVSIVLYLIAPATVRPGVDFQGIFTQKNVLGQAMTVGALAGLHCLRTGQKSRLRNLAWLAVMGSAALLSQSATSCLTIATFGGLEIIAAMYRRKGAARQFAVAALVVAVPLLIGAATASDAVLELIGKDPTLTGRTEIWEFVIRKIWERPVLGWGFFAFWSMSNPHAAELNDMLHWVVPQAHNGLLEVLLQLGVVGAALFIFLLLQTARTAARCFRIGQRSLGLTALFCCMAVVQIGVSEIILLAPFQSVTAVFLVLSLMTERALREAQTARPRHYRAAHDQPVRA